MLERMPCLSRSHVTTVIRTEKQYLLPRSSFDSITTLITTLSVFGPLSSLDVQPCLCERSVPNGFMKLNVVVGTHHHDTQLAVFPASNVGDDSSLLHLLEAFLVTL